MLTTNDILLFLRSNKNLFRNQFHCNEIGLFGSYARNEQTEESDIDILVKYESDVPNLYDTEQALKRFLSNKFNRNVDICSKKWINPVFKSAILKEAIYA